MAALLMRPGVYTLTVGINTLVEQGEIPPDELAGAIYNHLTGKWDELDDYDRQVNLDAIEHNGRVLTVHTLNGHRVYVISELSRHHTSVLLADEY
jgi:hypothetical protein